MRKFMILTALLALVPSAPALAQSIDPAAVSIDVAVLSRRTQFEGRIRITGTVRNVGDTAYRSAPGQQMVLLYEDDRVVARADFVDLLPGQSVRVSIERLWYTALEFPPTYRLVIVYDPDIRLDGRASNDDRRLDNNSIAKTGYEIHDAFRRSVFLSIAYRRLLLRPRFVLPRIGFAR